MKSLRERQILQQNLPFLLNAVKPYVYVEFLGM
jgi:hypothetical protein